MPADLDDSSPKTMSNNTASGEASVSSSGDQIEPLKPPPKKKRNQPGMPGNFSFFFLFINKDIYFFLIFFGG